jgi:N-methylhydantoinase A/acetophenone carboxylase
MGHEDTIYIGKGSQWAHGLTVEDQRDVAAMSKPNPLIPVDMTVGLRERIDCFGNVVIPLTQEEVLAKVQYLVDRGCRGFIVSLLWSFLNPEHERLVKQVIQEEYPDVYLGNAPIMLSSEVAPKLGEYARTTTTILNGYLHAEMKEELTSLAEDLRDEGFRKPVLIVHNTGGTAKTSRTTAVATHNAGPVAGLLGAAYLAKNLYEYDNVIVSDMGGTSFDIGVMARGSVRFYQFNPIIDRWLVNMSMIETKAIGAGGGSIAWIHPTYKTVQIGPQSAGSMPGPAAFDLGGTQPTVTDADIVLGYINPDYYLGGRNRLNRERSLQAIHEHIAAPLGIEVEEAALRIKKIVDGNMGNEIFKETALKGFDPREFVLFSYGGAGPTHCCGYAGYVGVKRVMTFPFASVFCAFGASTMDVMHQYEHSRHVILFDPKTGAKLEDYEQFNRTVRELQALAARDMQGEGFDADRIVWSLELEMRYGTQLNSARVFSPRVLLQGPDDVQAVLDAHTSEYSVVYGAIAAFPQGGVEIDTFVLKATVPVDKFEFAALPLEGSDPSAARKGERLVWWDDGPRETAIYERRLLRAGNVVAGPAVVEAEDTTYVIPPERVFRVDQYLNGSIEQA